MKCQIFVDAENIRPALFFTAYDKLAKEHTVSKCSIFGNLDKISKDYKNCSGKGNFKLYNSFVGKNSADLLLTTHLAKSIYCDITTELFIIMTNDNDFSPIIALATNEGKSIIVVSEKDRQLNHLKSYGADTNKVTYLAIDCSNQYEDKYPIESITRNHKDYKGETILFKKGKSFVELPFINGMDGGSFNRMLNCRGLRVSSKLRDDLTNNYLKMTKEGNITYYKEEEY